MAAGIELSQCVTSVIGLLSCVRVTAQVLGVRVCMQDSACRTAVRAGHDIVWSVVFCIGAAACQMHKDSCVHTVATKERGLHAAFGCERCQRCLGKHIKKHIRVVSTVANTSLFLEVCGVSLPYLQLYLQHRACSSPCCTVDTSSSFVSDGRELCIMAG